MENEPNLLVDAWIRRYESIEKHGNNSDDAKASFWAYEEFDQICMDDPEQAIDLIKRILASTRNEFVLENLAAGPLETVLGHHGNRVIDEVERSAKADPRFRLLLRGVWKNLMDEQIWARVLKAANK